MEESQHELRNVVLKGTAFFCIFLAFFSQSFIEQPVISSAAERGGISEHAGYKSLAIIYFSFFISNFLAVPIVEHTSAKWSMILGGCCYVLFQAGFLYLNEVFLYVSSAILGLGAAVIWTAQGNYITLISSESNSRRNSGYFWAIFQSSVMAGGIFLLAVFSFVGKGSISESTVRILYSVFTVVTIVGIGVLALLRNVRPQKRSEHVCIKDTMASTFQVMVTKKMILLAFAFSFTGFSCAMNTSVYPAVISFTKRLGPNTNALMAAYAICFGIGQIIGGCVFGILGDKTKPLGRENIVVSGMLLQLVVFGAIFVNFPAVASLKETDEIGLIEPSVVISMVCSLFLGLCDSIWNTQLYAFLVDNFRTQSTQAFALFKCYQALCACAAFFYSSSINLHGHLLVLVLSALLGAAGFYKCEKIIEKEAKKAQENEEHQELKKISDDKLNKKSNEAVKLDV